jgi:hypothetical protein
MKRAVVPIATNWIGMFLLLLLGTSVLTAQMPTATILGTVTDSTGATVPEAKLTARNLETGQARTVTSTADGSYRFPSLPVGRYEIRAEKSGFQTDVRTACGLIRAPLHPNPPVSWGMLQGISCEVLAWGTWIYR